MQKQVFRMLPFLIIAAFLLSSCAEDASQSTKAIQQNVSKEQKIRGPVYKGRIVGKSKKAKTLSLEVGKGAKAQTLLLKFDENTKGIQHATKGHGVIVTYKKQGKDTYVISIKPKLSKLPKGVSRIDTAALKTLIESESDFVLVDSRPAARYGQGHLPGAISIPVCEMQELISLLPKKKDTPLVFYCGGPT